MSTDGYRYWAFISYSHRDAAFGAWLHRAIESYRIPATLREGRGPDGTEVPRRLFPVFRDRDELPTSSDLGTMINDALESSRHLIVLCSPDSAESRWVNQEVESFCRVRSSRNVHRVILPRGPAEAPAPYGPALTRLGAEGAPLVPAIDLRVEDDPRDAARLALVAALAGVSAAALRAADAKRRTRRLTLLVGAVLALLAFAIPLAVMTIRSSREARAEEQRAGLARDEAVKQRRAAETSEAESRAVLTTARIREGWRAVEQGEDVAEGLLWQIEALRLMPPDSARAHAQRIRIRQLAERLDMPRYLGFSGPGWLQFASPAGGRIAALAPDGARIFDLRTGADVAPVLETASRLADLPKVAWSKDERLLALASGTLVQLWTIDDGGEAMEIDVDEHAEALRFSPDGDRLYIQQGGAVQCVGTSNGGTLFRTRHESPAKAWAATPDGRLYATHHEDARIRIWDAETGDLLKTLDDEGGAAGRCLAFHQSGLFLQSVDDQGRMRLWDLRSDFGHEPQFLPGRIRFNGLTLLRDGTVLIAYESGHVDLVNPQNKVTTFASQGAFIPVAEWGPAFKCLALGGQPGKTPLFNLNGESVRPSVRTPGWSVSLGFDRLGETIALRTYAGVFGAWPVERRFSDDETWLNAEDTVTSLDLRGDDTLVATGSERGFVTIWDADTGQVAARTARLGMLPIQRVGFFDSGESLLIHARGLADRSDARLYLWRSPWTDAPRSLDPGVTPLDAHPAEDGRIVVLHAKGIRIREADGSWRDAYRGAAQLAGRERYLSPDGATLAVPNDREIVLIDAASGRVRGESIRLARRLLAFAFDPRGERLATASFDGSARVWSTSTGEPLTEPLVHRDFAFDVVFDASGTRIVTSSGDRTARVWNASTGEPVGAPLAHVERVVSAVFDPTGTWIATGTIDGVLRVFEAETGEPVTPALLRGRHSAQSVIDRRWMATETEIRFSSDGGRVLSPSADGGAILVDLRADTRPVDVLADLAEFHAASRLTLAGELAPLSADAYRERWARLSMEHAEGATWKRSTASSRFWRLVEVATAYMGREELEASDDAVTAAIAEAEALRASDPRNPKWIRNHVFGVGQRMSLRKQERDYAGAEEAARQAAAICERLYEEDPDDVGEMLAGLYEELGFVQYEGGRREASRVSHRRSVALRRDILKVTPNDVEPRFRMAVALAQLARSLDETDPEQREEGLRVVDESLRLMKALDTEGRLAPSHRGWLQELANQRRRFGE